MTDSADASVPPSEVSALILAAGQGLRVGDRPKAFLTFAGRSLLERVAAQLAVFGSEVIAALPAEELEAGRRLLAGTTVQVVAGGATRQDTVTILCRLATRPLVLVQDVARPFASDRHIAAALSTGNSQGAAVSYRLGTQRDGVALREGDCYGVSLPRENVILTQTPQVYRREILLDALAQAECDGWQEISPAALVTRAGHRVALVQSPTENLKITFPEDLDVARRLLGSDERS